MFEQVYKRHYRCFSTPNLHLVTLSQGRPEDTNTARMRCTHTHLNLSLGHCSGNVHIHIIDKCISDLFIKPTALWETQRLSQTAVGVSWVANQSHLNGANMNRPLRGSYRWQPCMALQKEHHVHFTHSYTHGCTNRVSVLACGDWAATAVIIIYAIICSGVFVLAVIRQKHNIFPPSTLKALRHVSALKGLSYVAAPAETETPGDRAISLLYVFFLQLTTASIDLIHTHTHVCITYSRRDSNIAPILNWKQTF